MLKSHFPIQSTRNLEFHGVMIKGTLPSRVKMFKRLLWMMSRSTSILCARSLNWIVSLSLNVLSELWLPNNDFHKHVNIRVHVFKQAFPVRVKKFKYNALQRKCELPSEDCQKNLALQEMISKPCWPFMRGCSSKIPVERKKLLFQSWVCVCFSFGSLELREPSRAQNKKGQDAGDACFCHFFWSSLATTANMSQASQRQPHFHK